MVYSESQIQHDTKYIFKWKFSNFRFSLGRILDRDSQPELKIANSYVVFLNIFIALGIQKSEKLDVLSISVVQLWNLKEAQWDWLTINAPKMIENIICIDNSSNRTYLDWAIVVVSILS